MPKIILPTVTNTVIKNLLKEAPKLGIKVKQIDKRFLTFELTYKGSKHYFFHKKIGLNSANAALVSNKFITNQILNTANIKVPLSYLVTSGTEVKKLIQNKKIRYPFVIKPFDYSLGVAVTANITNQQMVSLAISRLQRYWRKAKDWGKKKKKHYIMVEEHVTGNDYRILVLKNKVIAVTQRAFPKITGDGKSTVKQLIYQYYQNHSYYLKKNKKPLIDKELKRNLKLSNINFSTVLTKNRVIRIRQTANVFGGGVTINVTDKIHPYYKKIASQITQLLNMDLAGIDLMAENISKKDNYRVIEINSFPALDMHENPDQGQPINVSRLILKSIFPKIK